MNATINLPPRIGDRILLRVEGERVYWRCDFVLPGATKPCGRHGDNSIDAWRIARNSVSCKRCAVRMRRYRTGSLPGNARSHVTATSGEYFKCKALDLKCTRSSCAALYVQFNAQTAEHTGSSCTKCAIGKAHAKGVAHDDAPAIARPVPVVTVKAERRCLLPKCKTLLPIGRSHFCSPECRAEAYKANVFVGVLASNYIEQPRSR